MNTKENKTIWVITNDKGVFIKACENREKALEMMKGWRKSCERVGLFQEVGEIDAAYYETISFTVVDKNGEERNCYARETILY